MTQEQSQLNSATAAPLEGRGSACPVEEGRRWRLVGTLSQPGQNYIEIMFRLITRRVARNGPTSDLS